ncbi:MAG: class I SAM-dependent methyltransferase [Kofleriaceae bacterium]
MRADATLVELVDALTGALARGDDTVELDVVDPDLGRGRFPGEPLALPDGTIARHRPWRVWVELADRLGLRLATPRPTTPPWVRLTFERLPPWRPRQLADDDRERYGATSTFARVRKLEDPGLVLDLADALERAALPPAPRVLDLGCGRGELLAHVCARVLGARATGVDRAASALALAQVAVPTGTFVEADLGELGALALGRFDLVLAFGVLQSPGVDDRSLLRAIVADHLTPRGAVILGVPNGRYHAGELVHGARQVNYTQPELGLVVKDVAFYRRYLQQHRRRVFVTGRHDLLVTAIPEAPAAPVR